MKTDVFQEHPRVTFKHKVYGEFAFSEKDQQTIKSYTYSTSKTIRDRSNSGVGENQLAPPMIKSSMQDFDRDGKAERWNITMRVKKP